METGPLEKFVGMPYRDDFDCADFAIHVQRELFNRNVPLPGERPRGLGSEAALADASKAYAVPTDEPEDGDGVLMYDIGDEDGSPTHVGVYIRIGYIAFVLHSGRKLGGSVMTRIDRLGRFGLTIEGYYKWLS